ncbi:unnamed protein product [Rotaria sp. Silwood1]|nr:unnamed protein product [Rotaria sp. Silwood1]
MMYSYIAHQRDEIVNYDPNARKETIIKMRDLEQQSSPARNNKKVTEAMSIIQSSSITLTDCYLTLSYLHLTTNRFVDSTETRTFGRFVGKVVDIRLKEFQNDIYLSAYCLHPKYRGSDMLTGASWWSMINDHTHKNSLFNIALRLFSITPHSVMPERLFSILDWYHTKRRNRLNSFTLEAIAKIHTFYKNGLNSTEDALDADYLKEILDLTDESYTSSGITDESNYSSTDAADFVQCVSDDHHVLCTKCEAESINEEQSFDDEDVSELDSMFNTKDRDYQ